MSGPTWAARKGTKSLLKGMGVPAQGAAIASFVVGGAVSMFTHDHWGHIPDADDLADLGACLFDDDCPEFLNTDDDPFCDRKVNFIGECDHTWKKHVA